MSESNGSVTDGQTNLAPVRLHLPKAILFAVSGTIAPQDWEESCITPYLRDNLVTFLQDNWPPSTEIDYYIELLTYQSFQEHFVYDQPDCPVVVNYSLSTDNRLQVIQTVNDYVMWQLARPNSSPEALQLVRLCWVDGFKNKKLKIK